MLTLFYSPHSTSVDNEAGRASGHTDPKLSAKGRKEALELGQRYASEKLDAVFCSDLQRAVTTAEIAFLRRGLPIIQDARLRECNYGTMTLQKPQSLQLERHLTEPYPEGESLYMVAERVGAFLRDVVRDYDGKRVVVIGHRGTHIGIEYWASEDSLELIVQTPRKLREPPIWQYDFDTDVLKKAYAG
jgi:broad specificity phosphatase PhoE